jgi:hypothetical protein
MLHVTPLVTAYVTVRFLTELYDMKLADYNTALQCIVNCILTQRSGVLSDHERTITEVSQ